MKKLTSVLLVLIMVLAMGASAFATSPIEAIGNGDATPVEVKVLDGNYSGTVYNVTVEWKSLQFTYQKAGAGTWNPDNHEYTDADEEGWVPTSEQSGDKNAVSSVVTVTNHSNAQVTVKATVDGEAEKTVNNVKVAVARSYGGDDTLSDASTTAYGVRANADYVTYDVTVSGTPNENWSSTFQQHSTIVVQLIG